MAKAQAVQRPSRPRRDRAAGAEALFARGGYRGVGLREIAAQVGIRPVVVQALPRHALYNAVLCNIFGRLARSVRGSGRRAARNAARGIRQRLHRPRRHRPDVAAPLPRADGAFRGDGRRHARRGIRDLPSHRRVSRGGSARWRVPPGRPLPLSGRTDRRDPLPQPAVGRTPRFSTAWRHPIGRRGRHRADLARGALLAPPPLARAARARR